MSRTRCLDYLLTECVKAQKPTPTHTFRFCGSITNDPYSQLI